MRWLVVGGGAREHAIAATLAQAGAELLVASPNTNPGLEHLAIGSRRLSVTDVTAVVAFAREAKADAAILGPEAPLAAGAADALRAAGIPSVGPGQQAARLESSKAFCRELLARHRVGGQPKSLVVAAPEEVDPAVASIGGAFVVKPDALTSGKGVWVQGADFAEDSEGADYAKGFLVQGTRVLLEEKLEGEEFSLMAFVTDSGVYPMPTVQDFKRSLEGDRGRNTGGMGAYSQRDHLLPFLSSAARDDAVKVLEEAVAALRAEGLPYRGILYGGFLLTAHGPKLLEFNVRFGDPEGINVLSLYEEGDFSELLLGVAEGHVDPNLMRFRLRSTVLKYLVPPGYGSQPKAGGLLVLDDAAISAEGVHVYYGQVDARGPGTVAMSSSRAVALVGEASAIHEAGTRVEKALAHVTGDYYVRHDIATPEDLERRKEHMRQLLVPGSKASPLPLSVAAPDAPASSAGPPEQLT